ncbi:phosphoglucosamine mutase [Fusibacter paucivorans]|uniref:Phosphoglucosamine mutase n=1 Tax=Fusibacter paucivorans TaxID=76009 RepID=A0ABS5PLI9_9FIRM|nr:phosphoglucosamine mutase [Fusibacter paucivorans]MBS7526028.1 phosphoglucosamine mutase [Fusibacter paucivorans]
MARLFGTDGVRGIANTELTVKLAMQLGKYGAHLITKGKENGMILVGKDTRISGDMLESALIAGILSTGCNVVRLGIIPTPAVAKLIRVLNADAGVMISASHNPVAFNGIKFFDENGFKLRDALEDEIEEAIRDKRDIDTTHIGVMTDYDQAEHDYIKETLKAVKGLSLEGLKVALDCANGSASFVAPMALNQLGAKVYAIHHEPDGYNINEGCGSTHLSNLQTFVKTIQADIGIAFDGDADRMLAIDEHGEIIDGDKIMAICAKAMKAKEILPEDTVVSTVMSNLGFDIALKEHALNAVKTQVGDRYVLEEMLANGYALGGEQSGHIIFLKHNTTGDGLLTAVKLLEVMKQTGKSASELAMIMKVYPQVLVNAKVANHKKHLYLQNDLIKQEIMTLESDFHGKGRVLVRPSGTEPLVRVMIEGECQEQLEVAAKTLAALIEQELG